MNGVKLGVSAAASWAWGTSLIVGMEIAQTKGLAAWGIWVTANAATLAVFGVLTCSGLFARPETRGAPSVLRDVKTLYAQFGSYWAQRDRRNVYHVLIAGDPKKRSPRARRAQSVISRNTKNAAH